MGIKMGRGHRTQMSGQTGLASAPMGLLGQTSRALIVPLLGATLLLSACAQREEILEGERLSLRDGFLGGEETPQIENKSAPIKLAAQNANSTWSHRAGDSDHRIQHPALGAGTTPVWIAKIGQGNDRKHRITADPVVDAGRIFTLDSRALVSATATASGAPIWQADLTPAGDRSDDASGGGLATLGGTLYITTGFGELVALDAASGAEQWRQRLEATATGAPTVSGDLVYVASKDNRAWAIEAKTGRIRWQFAGTPSPSSMVGGAGPALSKDLVVFPFTSGELVATFRKGGVERWKSRVVGGRVGKAYTRVTDITADPVIVGDTIYSGNQSGRLAAMSLGNGEVLWTAKEGAYSPLWIEGGSIFLISDAGELLRLNASDGSRIWGVQMPTFENDKPRRFKDVFAYYGPVLAGGKLWVATDEGLLRAFSPESGAELAAVALPSGAATNPVVADRTLFVVGQNGQLNAYK